MSTTSLSGEAPAGRGLPLLRSLLFIPATATPLLQKAAARGADALIIDLEDGVAAGRKEEARRLAGQALQALLPSGLPIVLRINAAPELARLDLEALPLQHLAAIMLPKVESPDQVEWVRAQAKLRCVEPPPIAALIESPLGVLAAREIACHPALVALGFGAEDYASALGISPEQPGLTWPAQMVITAAHAHGLQCWGLAASIGQIQDMDTFARDVDFARRIGFTGSVCIHPRQVPLVNQGFSPGEAEIIWARKVIQADEEARLAGQGAVQLEGRMIDAPIVERARRLLARARSGT